MKTIKIVTIPDPVLHAPTRKIADFNEKLKELTESMRETMHDAKGVGLAAPQIGLSEKIAVIEYDPTRFDEDDEKIPFHIIINPKIINYGDEWEVMEEGCLSVPGLSTPVPRATEVTVLAQNINGERIRIRARDFLARILQHEIDHLNGHMIVDRTIDKKTLKHYQEIFPVNHE